MSNPAPGDPMSPGDIAGLTGKQVTITDENGRQARALVTLSTVVFSRIDVTTEKQWIETKERQYIDGQPIVTIALEVIW